MCQVGDQHGVFDGAESAAVPEGWFEAVVLRLEVAVAGGEGGRGGFFERDGEPFGAAAGAAAATPAGRLVVAGAAAGPGGEVWGGGEDGHVGEGKAAGLSSDEREELRRLRRENRTLIEECQEPAAHGRRASL